MALNVEVGSFAVPAAGTTTITLASGFDPKAIICWTVGRTAAAGGGGHARFSYGFATYRGASVQQQYVAGASEDNSINADTYTSGNNNALGRLTNGTDATIALAFALSSMGSGASSDVVISYTTRLTGAMINYIVLGGSDVEDALATTFTGQTTPSTQDIDISAATGGSGWTGQPSLILTLFSWDGYPSSTFLGEMDPVVGFGVKQASANARMAAIASENGVATMVTRQRIANNAAAYAGGQLSVQEWEWQFSGSAAWPANGFEITYATGGQDFGSTQPYLALKLSSDVTVTHGQGAAPIAGGLPVAQTLASSGTPKLAFVLATRQATANTTDEGTDAAFMGVGAFDGSGNERFAALWDDDAAATSATGTAQSTSKALQYYVVGTDTLTSEADGLVNGSNFELSWTDIDATAFLYEWFTLGIATGATEETPTPGTATTTGISPVPDVTATPTPAAAAAAGTSPQASITATPLAGTATATGIEPDDGIEVPTTPTPGTATATGTSPTAAVTATPTRGIATATGISPPTAATTTPTVSLGQARTATIEHPGTTSSFLIALASAAPVRAGSGALFTRPATSAAFEQAETELVIT